jgi:hypothetical protein
VKAGGTYSYRIALKRQMTGVSLRADYPSNHIVAFNILLLKLTSVWNALTQFTINSLNCKRYQPLQQAAQNLPTTSQTCKLA